MPRPMLGRNGRKAMNERIRAKVVRGKLPEIKRPGSDELDTAAIIRLKSERKRTKYTRDRRLNA
jgi:hypothetical protein